MTQLSQIGELGLLAELERRRLITAVEHDAAQIGAVPTGETLVATQDALVENVHFRLDWIDWRALGFRAAAVNLSDLAASGATPVGLLVTLAVPETTLTADVIAFYEGIAEAGVPVVGGDTTSSEQVVISVTALGPATCSSSPALSARPVRRSAISSMRRRRCVSKKGDPSPRPHTRCWTCQTESASTRGTSRDAPVFGAWSTSMRCRWPTAQRSLTLGSARTSSCWPRSPTLRASRSSAVSRQATAS